MSQDFTKEFVTGRAGTGKTRLLKTRITESKPISDSKYLAARGKDNYGVLCATTGIAAVNLGGGLSDNVVTINSELGYFDTQSLMDNAADGYVQKSLAKVFNKGRNLIIDEISMMESDQFDILYKEVELFNKRSDVIDRGGLGLVVSGDFCQLPPVKGKFAFQGRYWSDFVGGDRERVTKLEKVWRQSDLGFLEALAKAREGDGDTAANMLKGIEGVEWRGVVNSNFDGTTVVATNKEVDRINNQRYQKLLREGKSEFKLASERWGKQRGEWKLIPDELELCDEAYVMILSNDSPNFSFANGDCGYVADYSSELGVVWVRLARNDVLTPIAPIIRKVEVKQTPNGMEDKLLDVPSWADRNDRIRMTIENRGEPNTPYYDYLRKRWVIGEIKYMPLRLAYATTCHKAQGLTLDRVQIDYHHEFFGQPSMSYVALSRVSSPSGLTLVGSERVVAVRTNVREEVLKWL